jgi:hypothetical protein
MAMMMVMFLVMVMVLPTRIFFATFDWRTFNDT